MIDIIDLSECIENERYLIVTFPKEGGYEFQIGGDVKVSALIYAMESVKHEVLTLDKAQDKDGNDIR